MIIYICLFILQNVNIRIQKKLRLEVWNDPFLFFTIRLIRRMLRYIKMSNVFIQAFIIIFPLAVVLDSDPRKFSRDFGCFGFRESKECLLFFFSSDAKSGPSYERDA